MFNTYASRSPYEPFVHSSAKRKKGNHMESNPMHPILGVCDMAGCPRFCVFGEVCPGFCVFAKTQDAGRKTQKYTSPPITPV